VGKTLSARRYTHWDLLEPALNPFPAAAGTDAPPEIVSCRSVLYTPSVATSTRRIGQEVDQLCGGLSWAIEQRLHPDDLDLFARWRAPWTELVVVDEADRLKLAALEELRERYDRGRIGLILIGMPGLEKRLVVRHTWIDG
jgi:AAA domain-containing protein